MARDENDRPYDDGQGRSLNPELMTGDVLSPRWSTDDTDEQPAIQVSGNETYILPDTSRRDVLDDPPRDVLDDPHDVLGSGGDRHDVLGGGQRCAERLRPGRPRHGLARLRRLRRGRRRARRA
ncbi:hypothetical protein [Nonomuraea salmonea]|uniref:hypothetical protein n=1 Tax=Nonomuraea salmonea TaxID=46181 RepID=UPI002FE9C936